MQLMATLMHSCMQTCHDSELASWQFTMLFFRDCHAGCSSCRVLLQSMITTTWAHCLLPSSSNDHTAVYDGRLTESQAQL